MSHANLNVRHKNTFMFSIDYNHTLGLFPLIYAPYKQYSNHLTYRMATFRIFQRLLAFYYKRIDYVHLSYLVYLRAPRKCKAMNR
jgi:hypothetical protein